jgi:hypothetical protein
VTKLAIAEAMIAHYNAQDADAYVALMTDDAVEAGYRGAALREGKAGVRAGLTAMFAQFPENRAAMSWGRLPCCTRRCGARRRVSRSR